MKKLATFEVGFYDENRGLVSYEECDAEFQSGRLPMLAFALFALRQWRNMGKNNMFADASAWMLGPGFGPGFDSPGFLERVRTFPHPSDPNLGGIVRRMPETLAEAPRLVFPILHSNAEERAPFRVVEQRGEPRRRFVGNVEERGGLCSLHEAAKGFGLLGSGLNYYAPASIFLLLDHLISHVLVNKEQMERVAERCVRVWLEREVTVGNQAALAAAIVAAAEGEPSPAFE